MLSIIFSFKRTLIIAVLLTTSFIIQPTVGEEQNPSLSDWMETTPLPQPMAASWWAGKKLIFHNDRVYIFGGKNADNAGNVVTNVYYSIINPDGTLGSWIETTSIPWYFDQDVVKIGDYVYLISGANSAVDVYYAPINQDGSLGDWTATEQLHPSRQGFALATYGDYIYSVAGNSGGMRDFVKFTSVMADGSLNPWQDTTPLPEPTQDTHTAVAYNNHLYVLAHTGNTYYAPINLDGTLGNWTTTTSMPEILSRYNTFEYNGYLYLLGGTSQSVYYTEILPNGSLGEWQTTVSLPEERRGARAGMYNGFIYVAGGYDGSNYQNTVYYAHNSTQEPELLVVLDTFSALAIKNGNRLDWETVAEPDSIGFFLWRAISTSGECTKNPNNYTDIARLEESGNPVFINAMGDLTSGAAYSYVDKGTEQNVPYCYVLEDINSAGESTFYLDNIVGVTRP